ncbi:pilus assembly protein TadG-related protein [Plantactinospora siamensis]|uniref:Pilus assembly protein TadG-related protein n=1 Tax=Plantactinospora siamensis TaxID=555372 RepID=A0ABV6NSD2_9ACTN
MPVSQTLRRLVEGASRRLAVPSSGRWLAERSPGRWLGERPASRSRGDRGAVAITVALLLGSGVLLGMAALVVDVGNLYAERTQLQSGADGAALRVAQECASAAGDCSAANRRDLAAGLARDNAADGAAAAQVCGRFEGDSVDCPAPTGGVPDCVGPAPDAGDYAEVHTGTETADGRTVLPPVFAQAVLSGFNGAHVTACSRVGWGAPATATGLAMTLSACDWRTLTNDGRRYPSTEGAIPLYDPDAPDACGAAAGTRGGFRWLAPTGADCRTTLSAGDAVGTDATLAGGCARALADLRDSGRPVAVPVIGAVTGAGSAARYEVRGFAAFVVTGWQLPGDDEPPAGAAPCATAGNCVYGHLVRDLVPGGGALGGPDLGARIVQPIG